VLHSAGGHGITGALFFKNERRISMSKVENGNTISVHYIGKLEDGEMFDSSRERGAPLSFEVGAGQMISGFENSVVGMTAGETKTVTLSPTEAYGEPDPTRVKAVPRTAFAPEMEFEEGVVVQGQTDIGIPFVAKIQSFDDNEVVLDLNHPLAGKTLNFEIEVVSINND